MAWATLKDLVTRVEINSTISHTIPAYLVLLPNLESILTPITNAQQERLRQRFDDIIEPWI